MFPLQVQLPSNYTDDNLLTLCPIHFQPFWCPQNAFLARPALPVITPFIFRYLHDTTSRLSLPQDRLARQTQLQTAKEEKPTIMQQQPAVPDAALTREAPNTPVTPPSSSSRFPTPSSPAPMPPSSSPHRAAQPPPSPTAEAPSQPEPTAAPAAPAAPPAPESSAPSRPDEVALVLASGGDSKSSAAEDSVKVVPAAPTASAPAMPAKETRSIKEPAAIGAVVAEAAATTRGVIGNGKGEVRKAGAAASPRPVVAVVNGPSALKVEVSSPAPAEKQKATNKGFGSPGRHRAPATKSKFYFFISLFSATQSLKQLIKTSRMG